MNFLLHHPFLLPQAVAWTSTRQGPEEAPKGLGGYSDFNLSFEVGDDPEQVRMRRELLGRYLPPVRWLEVEQLHSSRVLWIDRWREGIDQAADALITSRPTLGLLIKHADCQAALICDPQLCLVAAIHAGWRGLVQNIYQEVVDQLCRAGSRACQLRVVIAPSLGPCCSEFINWRKELGEVAESIRVEGKAHHFDLWKLAQLQLQAVGVEQIEVARLCTRCHSGRFFSFRAAAAGRCGRMLSGICLTS